MKFRRILPVLAFFSAIGVAGCGSSNEPTGDASVLAIDSAIGDDATVDATASDKTMDDGATVDARADDKQIDAAIDGNVTPDASTDDKQLDAKIDAAADSAMVDAAADATVDSAVVDAAPDAEADSAVVDAAADAAVDSAIVDAAACSAPDASMGASVCSSPTWNVTSPVAGYDSMSGTIIPTTIDIAVDSNGNLHMVYTTHTLLSPETSQIYYSYRPVGGAFGAREQIAFSPGGHEAAAIALGPTGGIHVVYRMGGALYHRYKPAGMSWGTEHFLDYAAGGEVALSVDSGNEFHTLFNTTAPALTWVKGTASGSPYTFATFATAYGDGSLALDRQNKVHIAFSVEAQPSTSIDPYNPVYYVTNASGGFVPEMVDSWTGSTGRGPNIGVDSLGGVHISYFQSLGLESGDIIYAFRPAGGTTFASSPAVHVNSAAQSGYAHGMTLDSLDNVHLFYADYGAVPLNSIFRHTIKTACATFASPTTVLSGPHATWPYYSSTLLEASVAVAPSGSVHLAFGSKNQWTAYARACD